MTKSLISSNRSDIGPGSTGNMVVQESVIKELHVHCGEVDPIKLFAGLNRYDMIGQYILKNIETASRTHPLYPDFGVRFRDDLKRLVSTPLTLEALEKYPKKIKGIFIIDYEKYPYMSRNETPMEYSYRTQTSVEFATKAYKEYLGDEIDRYPFTEFVDGMKAIISPPPFPEPMEGTIIAGEISIPVKMERKPCMEYGKMVFGSAVDSSGLVVSLTKYNGSEKSEVTISRVSGCSLKEKLQREKFFIALQKTKQFKILLGSSPLVDAHFGSESFKQDIFMSAEYFSMYIESLINIENHTNCSFSDIEDFTTKDFRLARILSSSLNDKWHQFKKDFDDELRIDYDSLLNDINDFQNEGEDIFSELKELCVSLHNQNFSIERSLTIYKDAKINNLESVAKHCKKRKRNILVTIRPSKGNQYFFKLCKFEGVKLISEEV